MKNLLIALLLLVCSGCAGMRPFSAMEAATDAVILADFAQTMKIAENPERWYERNPLLGDHPSPERVCWSIGGALAVNTILHRILPEKHLGRYQVALIVVESAAVVGNYNLGIRVGF